MWNEIGFVLAWNSGEIEKEKKGEIRYVQTIDEVILISHTEFDIFPSRGVSRFAQIIGAFKMRLNAVELVK